MLVVDPRLALFVGVVAGLAAAEYPGDGVEVTRMPVAALTGAHTLFDGHEIALAEGAPCESVHPGLAVRDVLEGNLRPELAMLFPSLAPEAPPGVEGARRFEAARPVVAAKAGGWQARATRAA